VWHHPGMGFLRRLFGSEERAVGEAAEAADPAEVEASERAYERELLQGEQARPDDLQQRQLRYAEYAWTPPPQGGEKRADDEDRERPAEG
jgi:hypothetical protein